MNRRLELAAHILDCEDKVERAIAGWALNMGVSRSEAAREVLTAALDDSMADPDLIEAAQKALRKEKRTS